MAILPPWHRDLLVCGGESAHTGWHSSSLVNPGAANKAEYEKKSLILFS